jgi:hypothetical protein
MPYEMQLRENSQDISYSSSVTERELTSQSDEYGLEQD